MSCLQKASFQNLVESNKEESHVRLNCDWEVSKIVVCQQIIGYSRKSFLQFTGYDSEIQLYNYVKELINEGLLINFHYCFLCIQKYIQLSLHRHH